MASDKSQTTTMRQRLAEIITRQDAERGRPLTDAERLENLAARLSEIDDDPCEECPDNWPTDPWETSGPGRSAESV